ncbi:unnamed protein product [Vitrella brassicaformis CCMP3155]|uniref:Uncharacterized protein n=1 Tax=Vitrella brassicaformis (strain CCMP3155) TaxID=1169540 RepID=A0A0G4EJ77_VITBC|nr:unnamed protein product [Vitrella brassicaformis CCMP3155]|mmetsp:Transcript_48417/g.121226  ORF Transcript_48417/g.121226 Transcript_48417/m.121226 type:complete len:108 (-) Transcript_48417:478-801(-)|eukprot:CEL97067.1 unnamed protein product [Vitrella brassicaformis CCMP3155]
MSLQESRMSNSGTLKRINSADKGLSLPPMSIDAPTRGPEYTRVFYSRSNAVYGSQQPSRLEPPKHGLNGRYAELLAKAGPYRYFGLKTKVDTARWIDGEKDWIDKSI